MKLCIDCEFHTRVATPMQGTMQMVDVCENSENLNPVDGTTLPCAMLRQNEAFCGMRTPKFFKVKEKQPEPEGTLIQLHK